MDNSQFNYKQSSFWSNLFKVPTESSEIELLLKNTPLFNELSKKGMKQLVKLIHNREYSTDELIFRQDDPGIALYLIISGNVKIVYRHSDGKITEMTEYESGDFFGELALIENSKRSASAISLNNSKIAVIFNKDLDSFIEQNPVEGIKVLRGLNKIVVTRLKRLNTDYYNLIESIDSKEQS